MMEPFTSVDVLAVASKVLLDPIDDIVDRLDYRKLDALLEEVNRCLGPDVVSACGVLFHGLVTRRPFGGGDDQVALATTLQLFAINGYDLDLEPPEFALDLVNEIRGGTMGPEVVAARLALRLRRPVDPFTMLFPNRDDMTRSARAALDQAYRSAVVSGSDVISTSHLLLGLAEERVAITSSVLIELGVTVASLLRQIERRPPESLPSSLAIGGETEVDRNAGYRTMALSVNLQQVLDVAATHGGRSAPSDAPFSAEDLLVALIRNGDATGTALLLERGVDLDELRHTISDRVDLGRMPESASTYPVLREMLAHQGEWQRNMRIALDSVFEQHEAAVNENARLRNLLRQQGIDPDAPAPSSSETA